jgi:hypothetical protein
MGRIVVEPVTTSSCSPEAFEHAEVKARSPTMATHADTRTANGRTDADTRELTVAAYLRR